MPKMKRHKGLLKRVKVTARGKVVASRRSGAAKLMSGKPGRRRVRLRRALVLSTANANRALRAMCAE